MCKSKVSEFETSWFGKVITIAIRVEEVFEYYNYLYTIFYWLTNYEFLYILNYVLVKVYYHYHNIMFVCIGFRLAFFSVNLLEYLQLFST